jgi:hypothetical protein
MGWLVAIYPDGKEKTWEAPKLSFQQVKDIIGNNCSIIERTKVKYRGKARDCWMDEEGLLKRNLRNPFVQALSQDYWGLQTQEFAGTGVIWIP